jgi:hypothetical protein
MYGRYDFPDKPARVGTSQADMGEATGKVATKADRLWAQVKGCDAPELGLERRLYRLMDSADGCALQRTLWRLGSLQGWLGEQNLELAALLRFGETPSQLERRARGLLADPSANALVDGLDWPDLEQVWARLAILVSPGVEHAVKDFLAKDGATQLWRDKPFGPRMAALLASARGEPAISAILPRLDATHACACPMAVNRMECGPAYAFWYLIPALYERLLREGKRPRDAGYVVAQLMYGLEDFSAFLDRQRGIRLTDWFYERPRVDSFDMANLERIARIGLRRSRVQ